MNKYLTTKDSIYNLLMILGLHLIFFLTSYYLVTNFQLIYSLPLFILLSFIHHKFLGEFIHEGCHYHLNKNKNINEIISNYLVGIFFLVTVKNYRKKHFKHHEFDVFFNPEDPETGPLKIYKKEEFWKNVFLDLIGFNGFMFLLNYTNQNAKSRSSSDKQSGKFAVDKVFIIFLIIHLSLFTFSIQNNFLIFYLAYFITLGTLYYLQVRLRVVCQHIFLNNDNKIQYDKTTSRTIKGGVLEKLFFTSDITAFHDLHHEFPHYPFRKCKEIFEQKIDLNNKNIFSTTRSDIIMNYYKSLS